MHGHRIFVFSATALLAIFAVAIPRPKAACGYESCPKPKEGMMNVHLIPHTHDDVGWLKTVDQYFYGRWNDIQVVGVQFIIDSVVSELKKDPSRRFIYVETSYLRQWWNQQPESVKNDVRFLVESGQLEIISGGWSMHDEAVTHYHSIIDQFSWGFKNLDEMFGTTCAQPHIGWQIDPFGHARETGSLMTMMGFDGLFFARLDSTDKLWRIARKELELVWKTSANHGGSSYLFTSIMHDYYYPPAGYCFDIICNDAPIIDDQRSPDYNVDRRVNGFIRYINQQSRKLTSNNILIPMGTDFSYQMANMWYENMDKLIKYVNERQETGDKINLMYSTPSCYLKAVHDFGNNYTLKEDDFFPYSSDLHSYWTGYYTSRPTLKFMERKGNNLLQVAKQLSVLANLPEERWEDLSLLREAMGIMQHHDAITGTEKQHVAQDYALRLHKAMLDSHETTERALQVLVTKEEAADPLQFKSCLLLNTSSCDVSEENETFVVTLYNPQAHTTSMFVRLPVQEFVYGVIDGTGASLETQMLKIPSSVLGMPGRNSRAKQELVFQAIDIRPLGFKSFFIIRRDLPLQPPNAINKFEITNEILRVTFSEDQHRLVSVKNLVTDKVYALSQDFKYYESYAGINLLPATMSSGAYIFRPKSDDKLPVSLTPPQIEVYEGALVNKVHQIFNEWISCVTRIFKGQEEIETEWVVGPIPVEDEIGKEIVTVYKVDGWDTNGTIFTDSNGREILKRVRNYRPTWDFNPRWEPVASNFYPITTGISMRDYSDTSKEDEFAVVIDRAQGGASIADGEIELMLHRRLLRDDDKGVAEALNETAFGTGLVARGKHVLFFGNSNGSPTAAFKLRKLATERMVLAPWIFLSPTTTNADHWRFNYHTQYTGLKVELTENINILTLEPWGGDDILVRVEHYMESTDDFEFSKPTQVSLMGLIDRITSDKTISERTLGGNQLLSENNRLEFKVEDKEYVNQQLPRPDSSESFDSISL